MIETKNNLGKMFLDRCEKSKTDNAIGWFENGQPKFINYGDYKNIVETLCLALMKKGLHPGCKLSIISKTCKEWHFIDLATISARAIVVPIYPTYSGAEIEYIFNHSESTFLVLEDNEQFKKLVGVITQMKDLKLIISFEELTEENKKLIQNQIEFISYKELFQEGIQEVKENADKFNLSISEMSPNETASIIYTSGTTGEPKGAVLTHLAFVTMLKNITSLTRGAFNKHDRTLVFLPLSHVFGRCDSLLPIIFGLEMVFAESMEKLLENINESKPTIMLAVPRIFEKIHEKIMEHLKNDSFVKKQIFDWAMGVSENYFNKIDQDLSPTTLELTQRKLAYEFIFSKIYEKFGGKIRFFVSGGAPLSIELAKFLRNANLTILEGYGLTETVGPICLNQTNRQKIGTVGIPMGEVLISFGEDNEIFIKSNCLLKEYYKNQKATNESLIDGWFHSGDIGHFDENGYLKITDRKKDIIVTSGGKNIAPQKIENLMKNGEVISHFLAIGDRRNYLVGLVGIEKSKFLPYLEEMNLQKDCSLLEIANHPRTKELIQKDIDNANLELAKFETIKKFYIVPQEFTIEGGFLTPSLKVRKKIIFERYRDQIDTLYQV